MTTATMTTTIPVKYIDTRKYTVRVKQDWDAEDPTDWGNFTVVQLKDRDFNNYDSDPDGIFTEEGKLTPAAQAKLRAGVMFTIRYYRYSNSDGGHYLLDGAIQGTRDSIDGFIIFDPDYIKGTSYEERKRYAEGDLKQYSQWAQGEVYGYSIEDEFGNDIDSCWGYYGDDIQRGIAEAIPDAQPDNVKVVGVYVGNCGPEQTYELYFDFEDCLNYASK